jgi:hypothetical protein
LLASLQNYLSNEAERARCLKRGGKVELVDLDFEWAEDRYGMEPVETVSPEKIFVARWTMALLGEASNRLRREYLDQGRSRLCRLFWTPLTLLKSFRRTKMSRIGFGLASDRLRR